MSDASSSTVQMLLAHEAKKNGTFDSWHKSFISAARTKKCAAALVPSRLIHEIIQGSLNSAAEIVANDQAKRLAKIEGEGEAAEAARAAIVRVPANKITSAETKHQWDLSSLIYRWTDKKKDWQMFNQLGTDDPELGTKMFLLVMRKYMSSGSAPSQNWSKEMRRKQGENETSEDVWDRIKVCAAALDSAGRPQSRLSMFDALKENLSSAHTHWVNTIADTWTLEEVDSAVFNHGQFVDNKEGRGDSKTNAAYPAVDSGDSRDLTIRELTACIARLEEQVNRMAAGTSGSGKGAGRFTGECHYCHKPGHKISECKKLKEKNQASGKGSSGGESSSGGAAFPACLAAHFVDHVDGASDFWDDLDTASDCSDYDAAGATVTAVLPVYNSFDLLGDLDELPDELVDELTSGESPSAENSVPATLPGLQSPPELDFDKTQKLDWVWDFISGQWVDPVKFPSILTHRMDPRSGLIYTSLLNLAMKTTRTWQGTRDGWISIIHFSEISVRNRMTQIPSPLLRLLLVGSRRNLFARTGMLPDLWKFRNLICLLATSQYPTVARSYLPVTVRAMRRSPFILKASPIMRGGASVVRLAWKGGRGVMILVPSSQRMVSILRSPMHPRRQLPPRRVTPGLLMRRLMTIPSP